ncbi:MAG: PD-(D/E)XK nuclease family protein [Leucobacter sp.]
MPEFDSSQRLVFALDTSRHASVLGAPGSGKTTTLIESYARLTERSEWAEGEVLVLASSRLVASSLRSKLERRVQRAVGGTPVRTPVSLAFAVLAREAASEGLEAPRLLTGTAHDEVVAEVIAGHLETERIREQFVPELMQSAPFRAELRELSRVLDDAALDAGTLGAHLREAAEQRAGEAYSRLPGVEVLAQWRAALELLVATERQLDETRPGELTASGLLRAATETLTRGVLGDAVIPVPRLILIDDAHELTEGALALVAACVAAGSRVWAFGCPDIATSAYRGERVDLLSRMDAELARRGAGPTPGAKPSQHIVLSSVHRHSSELRSLVYGLTERIGAAGAGEQRAATSVRDAGPVTDGVQFVTVPGVTEQLGVIGHRLRRRRLGLDGLEPLPWEKMAVVCRTRDEANAAARSLAGLGVETSVTSGGIVLREQRIVRELSRLLLHALDIERLTSSDVLEILGGEIGGLDPIMLRRFRGALRLQERRAARRDQREPQPLDVIVAEALTQPERDPVMDSAGGRALRRIAKLVAEGSRVHEAGGTPRETLWALWDGTRLANSLQDEALDAKGVRSDEAHRTLDGVLGLFFVLQRHEEQDSDVPIVDVIDEVITSTVPEDSLAARSARDVVTVTTPQGLVGTEFALVAVLGPQDGVWPNLRARGSLLGVTALERWLRGGTALVPDRRDTLHDELRLFAHTCARATDELLVVAVADEDHHPSTLFSIAHPGYEGVLPSSRLTLRGAVAEMRRRLTRDPEDAEALASLTALTHEGIPGAHPDEWYGTRPPTTERPLVDVEGDPEATVPVSPSQLEKAERCPLDWAIDRLGGGSPNFSSQLGTLLHNAFEQIDEPDQERIFALVEAEWDALEFDAEWESERSLRLARTMAEGLATYLEDFAESSRELVGHELEFSVHIGRAELRGVADRLERVTRSDGQAEILVVDLKTGKTAPSGIALDEHAQLQAYQLGVLHGAFGEQAGNGGAALIYVHPDALRTSDSGYSLRAQQPLDEMTQAAVAERITTTAKAMAGGHFTARVEHHCANNYSLGGSCRLHIIPAVSHA